MLHVYRHYFPDGFGGVAESIKQICKATSTLGFQNSVFTLSSRPTPQTIQIENVHVSRAKSIAAPFSCNIGGNQSIRLFRKMTQEADIIHYHFPWPFADLLDLLVRPSLPKVMTWHSDIVRQSMLNLFYLPLMYKTLQKIKVVAATSSAYEKSSSTLKRIKSSKKRVICLGIDETLLLQQSDDYIFKRIDLNPDKPYVLFIGCTRYYKGLKYLIDASSSVRTRIVIAGNGPELPYLQQYALAKSAKNVIFCGSITNAEKRSLLMKCCVFVLPSHLRSEAYGMVLVEASIFGKPMVTCEIGTGTSFVNIHNETGFVVQPANSAALSRSLNILLSDASLAAKMGKAARKRYENNFTGQEMGKAYAKLYADAGRAHQK